MTTIAQVAVNFRGDVGSLMADAQKHGSTAGAHAGESFAAQFRAGVTKGIGLGAGLGIERLAEEGIAKVKEFLGESLNLAREVQVTTERLTAALTANVRGWDGNTEAITRQEEKAKELGFTSEEVRKSYIGLVAATHDVGKATEAENVAMDLARFKHISLEEASQSLVKVEAGRYRALADLGIQLQKGATHEEALARVRAVVSGQAAAFMNTEAGAQAKLAAEVEGLQLKVGNALLPVMAELTRFLANELVPDIEKVSKAFGDAIQPITEFFGKAKTGTADMGVAISLGMKGIVAELSVLDAAMNLDINRAVRLVKEWQDDVLITVMGGMGKLTAELQPAIRRAFDLEHGITEQIPAVTAAAVQVTGILPKEALKARASSQQGGIKEVEAYLQGIDSGQQGVAQAWLRLERIQKDSLDNAHRLAIVGGMLASSKFADGVNSKDPEVRAAARAVALDAIAQLAAVGGVAGLLGSQAGKAFAASFGAGAGVKGQVNTVALTTTQIMTAYETALRMGGIQTVKYTSDTAKLTAEFLGLGNAASSGTGKTHGLTAAQKDHAATLRTAVANAWDAVKRQAEAYYDSVHQKNLKAISDALELARTQHTAAIQAADDALKAKQATDAAPVTAAEKALRDREQEQRERDLREALATAQQGRLDTATGAYVVDPIAVRSAREALDNFLAQKAIDQLRDTQTRDDKQAQQDHDNAVTAADTKLKDAETAAATAKAAEDKRFKAERARFEAHYAALKRDAHVNGQKIAELLAEGLLAGVPAVEKAAAALAAAVAKYIKTGSPAKAGPFHDDPPDKMGERVGLEWVNGVVTMVTRSGPAITAAVAVPAAVLAGAAGQQGQQGQSGQGTPATYDAAKWAYYTSMGGAASGLSLQDWLAGVAAGTAPNEFGMTPGAYSAAATTYREPLTQVDRTSGQMFSGVGPSSGPVDRSITVNVANPTAEPASTSAKRELQLLAVTGILG